MAPDKKEKKRKAASAPTDPPTKKSKKVSATEQAPEAPAKSVLKKGNKSTDGNEALHVKANGESTRKAPSRKRASDFLSDEDESDKESAEEATKPAKKQETKNKKSKNVEVVEQVSEEEEEENADDEIDDQTADLIKGFESSGDEDPSDDEGLDSSKPVPRIPDSKKAKRKIQKKLKANEEPETPGAVYVGRIPHGFYEHQMRAYFSQFGDITRLRLSRNRVTGSSKHYAFIEFASATVAKIVAETMNNYLMYGHILKCKYVPQEQQHPELWKGANRRYKAVPWSKIEKQRLDRGKTRDKWTKSIEAETKRRVAKAEKLKALGYEIDLPALKGVDEVPVQETPAAIEDSSEPKAIEPAATADEAEKTPKKSAKAKKEDEEKATPASKAANAEKATPSSAKSEGKKTKKSPGKAKKAKA
ncbi:putative RNA-binding protein C1827,05c [Talaromyces islandicus]|uniref:Putative RNA-binding protein C1827,05c n=1 Tax=Talaromyces islandicus TaxID=28573 RepID=A0A0U1LRV7_TALIS|nr:putative RNA-binding protein C1827,05c [Talaromyces islandicus]